MPRALSFNRDIPLDDSWDVIVIGGGPSGCTAATAAAREGARTLLIEGTGCLGGMGTVGLVPAWCPFSDGEKIIYRGLAERVFEESKKGVPHESPEKLDWVAINPEQLKRVYDRLLTDAGVDVLFFTAACAVEAAEGRLRAVIGANKEGLRAFAAPVFVDCTGDADIAAWSGAPWKKGRRDGEMQPATFCFVLSNVDGETYASRTNLHAANPNSQVWLIAESDDYDLIRDAHCCQNLIGPNTVGFNAGHLWDVDSTDPVNVSKAMMTGRRQAAQFRNGLAEFCPEAFGNAFLAQTASLMGIRETRRIEGDYVLSTEDYVQRRSFEDEIARNCYFIDIHTAKEEVAAVRAERTNVVDRRVERYGKGESHGIPYRCLIPLGLSNVLVAGRCISADRTVQGSIRVMPVCLATGEAAGLAAAMAGAEGDTRAVNTQDLRGRLRAYGAYLP
jgi:glycine/D-amino acid oxidase-like deaminating enzyme